MRHMATKYLVHELKSRLAWQGLKAYPDIPELSTTTGLLLVSPLHFDRLGDRLPVRNLGHRHHDIHSEFLRHSPDCDINMRVTHAGDDRLVGVWIASHHQSRILFNQASQGRAHLVQVSFRLGSHRTKGHRVRELDACKCDHMVLVTQRVPGTREL